MTRRQERKTAFHAQLEVTEKEKEIGLDDMPMRAGASRDPERLCAYVGEREGKVKLCEAFRRSRNLRSGHDS